MAQDAELRLKVSLDLAFFRQQLAGLGQVSAGYKMPVQVKFDRSSVQNELNALGSNIRRRNYFLEVKTNLKAEIKNAKDLASELSKLSSGAGGALPRKAGTFRQELTQLNIGQIQAIYAAAARAGLVAFDSEINKEKGKIVTALNQAANDAGQGFLNAFSKQNSLVKKAAGEYGNALLSGLKKTLRIESPSREMFNIGEDAGKGFELGLLRSMELAEQSATRKMQRMLDRLARMALMMGGMSPAAIGQQAAGFRGSGIAAPSWAATVPPGQAIGGGGRILPPAPIFPALSGTGGPGQKLLMGDLLDAELKEILRNAANTFVDEFRTAMNSAVRQTRVEDLGVAIRGVLPPGANPPSRPLLPAAGGTGGYFNAGGRRPGGGFVPPGGMPSDAAAQLYPSTFIGPGSSMEKFKTAIDIANASVRNFRASSIPLIGGLKEIGGEFLNATKQVLLYGTAYKGLAFVTSLPGQILNAAKSQQQFSNAMQTATQDTGTFAKEMLYVDNVQRAFGLNLETTRQGFVRLYASMAPTGFDSGSIEKLFTGISAATAALQLTPDKAERVIYAFGQMASKGQIMSEELKGQLGDVLPGALALFAKAAGMSVKEFSQAMENGEFVGQRFREVFAKVSDELINRFGTGAQAAGKSLQGLLNTVQGDFQRTLESFAPMANAAAQAILGPLSSSLKQLSMAAQLAMGEQERVRKQLASAKGDVGSLIAGGAKPEQIRAAEQNVAALQAKMESLNMAAKDPAIAKQAKDITAFVGQVTKAATAVMNIANAIGSVLNPIMIFLGTNLSTVITLLTSFTLGLAAVRVIGMATMGVLTLLNIAVKQMAGGVVSANALSIAFRTLGINASAAQVGVIGLGTALKVLLVSSGIGIAVALFTAIAGAALSMGDAMKQASQDAKQAMADMAQAAIQGNAALVQMRAATFKANISALQEIKQEIGATAKTVGAGRATAIQTVTITSTQSQILKSIGVDIPPGSAVDKGLLDKAINDAMYVQQTGAKAAQKYEDIAKRNQVKLGIGQPSPIVQGAAGTAADSTRKSSLESYYSLEDQLAKAFTQAEIDRIKQEHQYRVELINAEYDLREARANSFQKEALAFERKVVEINLERQGKLIDAANAVRAASGGTVRQTGSPGPTPPGLGMVPVGVAGALPPGQNAMNTPVGARVGAGPIRKVGSNERRDLLADQQRAIALTNQSTVAKRAEEQAIAKTEVALQQYLNAIMPSGEQQLQNFLLEKRNSLLAQGLSDSVIQRETKLFENQEKTRYGLEVINRLEKDGAINADMAAKYRKNLTDRLGEFNQATIQSIALQERQLELEGLSKAQRRLQVTGAGLMAGFYGSAAQTYEDQLAQGRSPEYAQQMAQLESQAMQLESVFGGIQNAIGGIGDAFGTMMTQGITQLIQGTASAQEVFSSFLKSVGDALLQAASQMISTYVAIGIARIFAGLGGGGEQPDKVTNFNAAVAAYGLAEGGYLPGGFKAFADGGMVTGPTLGLIGEGGEPEYVIPQSKMRGAMERYAAGARGASVIPTSPGGTGGGNELAAMMAPIEVKYQVERINSVDYVTNEQFQMGMRRAATQGAVQGEQRTLKRLQMSSSTRKRVGL